MLIACPSKGRAAQVRTAQYMPAVTVFVPRLEREAYISGGIAERKCVPVPDKVMGITLTRNWILDWAQKRGHRWIVMVDDDLQSLGWRELRSRKAKHRTISSDVMIGEWIKLFEITSGIGYRLWGMSTESATRSVYPYRPFIFHTYVTASCMGIISDPDKPVRFDERFPVKEDYELCLRCIQEDGGIVGARYLFWANDHWKRGGGCASYRTQQMEERAIDLLMELYPGRVVRRPNKQSEHTIDLIF